METIIRSEYSKYKIGSQYEIVNKYNDVLEKIEKVEDFDNAINNHRNSTNEADYWKSLIDVLDTGISLATCLTGASLLHHQVC